MDLSLTALGRQWIGGPLREDVAIGNALPPLGFGPGGLGNATLGGKTTYYDATADGKAVLSINLDEPFFEPMPKDGKVPEGARVFNCPRAGNFLDRGIRCQRYLALDTSGDCGAPVLLVILDRIEAESPRWALGLAREAGPIQMDGPTAVAGSATGANLKATFIAPANVKLEGGLTATGGKEYFVVLTVQAGVAPEVKVEGQGSAAKVRIGKRQITFDGQKIVLGE